MKSKIIKGVLLGSLTTLVFACNTKKEESATVAAVTVDKEQVKKDIQAREDEFAAVYNSGIPKNIGYYADDAVSFYPNRPPLVGKEAIVAFLQSDPVAKFDKLSFTTKDVFVSSDGNQIVEIGNFKLTDSASAVINTGNYMSLFEKRDGKYVCLRDMSTSDMPLQPQ